MTERLICEQKIIQENGYTTSETIVGDELGLHARPSALIVKKCHSYEKEVYLTKTENPDEKYNCKHIMKLMTMEAQHKTPIKIYVQGIDDKAKKVCQDVLFVLSADLETIAEEFDREVSKRTLGQN